MTVRSATIPGNTTKKPRNWRKDMIQLVIAVAFALAVKAWVLGSYRVSGDSLAPEIPGGSYVLAWKPTATFRPGDLIVYRHEGRVLGGRIEGSDAASLVINRNGVSAERIARKTVCGRIVSVLWRGSGPASMKGTDKATRDGKETNSPGSGAKQRLAVTREPAALSADKGSLRWTYETAVAEANEVAEKAGYNLKDYDVPQWTIDSDVAKIKIAYAHKNPAPPGSSFTVWIDIASGKAKLVKGE